MIFAKISARFVFASLTALAGMGYAQSSGEGQSEPPAQPQSETQTPEAETAPAEEIAPPRLIEHVNPVYPAAAKEAGVEDEVVLDVDIDAEGNVEGVMVTVPAQNPDYGFDDAALEAASLLQFEPATLGGEPVPVRIAYRYRFVLDAERESQAPEEPQDGQEQGGDEGPAAKDGEEARAPDPVVNFSGALVERGTRDVLAGVVVVVFRGLDESSTGFEAVTDAEGQFVFYDLEPGEWNVYAEPEGYYPLRTTETIEQGARTDAKYYLERGSYNPFDVLVEGVRQKKEVNRTTLAIEQVEKVPGTFGDVLAVVQNFPGVARPGFNQSLIIVRGSAPEDSQVFVDGVDVPLLYHFGGVRSVIPLGMFESIDFYPGNFSTYYGRATGGIVDVQLRDLDPDKLGGYLDVSLIDTGVFVEAPLGDKAAVAVAGRRSYIDALFGFFVPDDAPVNVITAPRYYDYQLLLTAAPASAHRLRAFVFGSDDDLEVLFRNPADLSPQLTASRATTSSAFYRTVLEHAWVPSQKVENVFKTTSGRSWLNFGLGDQLYFNLDTYQAQVRDTLKIRLIEALTLKAGVDYLFTKTDVKIAFPAVAKEGEPGGRPDLDTIEEISLKDQGYHSVGVFFEPEITLWERLLLIPGVRYDYFSRTDEHAVSPRLIARLALGQRWALKGGVGLFTQEPTFDETAPEVGNPDLGLEKAIHYSGGFEFRPLEYLTLDTTFFYKSLHDLVSRTTEVVERGGEAVPLNFDNKGEGRVYGMELLLRHDFANNFTGWFTYTLSRSERRDSGENGYRLFDFDQTHILAVLGTYKLPRNWEIGARWRLVSGNPSTPVTGSIFNVDDGFYEPTFGEANSDRLPPFHQLDVRVDKRWIFDNWMLTAYLDIQNVYNRANAEGTSYNFDYSKKRVQQSLPLLPVLGVKGEF